MAWNEPGNNNNDPWKNKGGKDQGPPDLDDIFKGLSNKFGKFSNNKGFGLGSALVLIVLVVMWWLSGWYTIKEAEDGVLLEFGKFDTIVEPGLHWKATFVETVIPVDVKTIRELRTRGDMLTQDENLVRVEMEIQFRVLNARNYLFSVTDAQDSLSQAVDSALRYVVGHSLMDDVLTRGREGVRQATWSELEKVIETYDMGIEIIDVNFKDARPPEAVKDAFDDAIAAQEDEERFIREAEAYAREIEPAARGRVERITQEAKAYKQRVVLESQGEIAAFDKLLPEYKAAPEVTRERLYLEALEHVYGNTSKVMVDVEGGGNMLYLPLDKIMQQNQTYTPSVPVRQQDVSNMRQPVTGVNSSPTTLRSDRRSGRN